MDFNVGSRGFGFVVNEVSDIPEVGGKAIVMTHEASGARLLYLANDDANKAFSISFKTPPADNTGVFHILEHTVLCGSRKFPVKEPFVNLLKGSMQTFLNAMTFSDKTMYPVSSTNEQDLMNLMDVYMDAVLHPNIYQKKTIFQQEGWHYELAEDEPDGLAHDGEEPCRDASAAAEADAGQGVLVYNGVVYNEMKGALSDPESVLYNALCAQLFPDTAYRFESGGAPSDIPQLSYEQFLQVHRNHYRLDNGYLFLYGNLNPDRFLGFLDESYLAPCAQLNRDSDGPNELRLQEPVSSFGNSITMITLPENSCMALGYVAGRACEDVRITAVDILLDAIAGSNESPLKRALIDADLADDVSTTLVDSTLQPFAILQLRGLRPGASARFKAVVEEAVRQLAGEEPDADMGMQVGPLDREVVEAAISHAEFIMRERSFGVSDGVAFAMTSMAGWLYDEDGATRYLRYEDTFKYLRAQLENGYFENLLREIFLENDHAAGVELVPVAQEGETQEALRLAQIAQGFSDEDFAQVQADLEALRAAQEAPDTPEQLATLPHLGVADIDPAPEEPAFYLDEEGAVPVIRHELDSRGIIYAYRYYDLNGISFQDLPYVTILANVLGKLDTAQYTAAQMDTTVQARLGNLSFFPELHVNVDDTSILHPKFVVGASALPDNAQYLASLPASVLSETCFDDGDRIRDILIQRRVGMEQGYVTSGNAAAMNRVGSYYSLASRYREQQGGVDFYLFLKELLEDFDNRFEDLAAKLKDLCQAIFFKSPCVVGFTGSSEDLAAYRSHCARFGLDCRMDDPLPKALEVPQPCPRNEAFIVPSNITFASVGYDRNKLGEGHDGVWNIVSRALSYDYLWKEVRMKGGAYGCGFQALMGGSMRFYSYRDPHLDQTIARFGQAAQWLEEFDPEDEEMEGYIVSTVAGMDAPMKPRAMARKHDGWFFGGYDAKRKARTRQQIIDVTPEQVRQKARTVKGVIDADCRCVFGNGKVIGKSQLDWNVVELIGKSDSSEASGSDSGSMDS